MKCKVIIEYPNNGLPIYVKCDKPVKFIISYNDTSQGQRVEECVCGVHRLSRKKWSERVEKKYNFKTEYSEKCILL